MLNLNLSKQTQEMAKMLDEIHVSLKKAAAYSNRNGLYGCERTLLHMISHIQTMREQLTETDPGFSL